jgi:hypothetical protein
MRAARDGARLAALAAPVGTAARKTRARAMKAATAVVAGREVLS